MGFHSKARQEASEFFTPEEGADYKVVVVEVREKETAAGYPAYGMWLEILEGDGQGERFWDNVFFSANNRANAMSYNKLEAACPTMNDTFWDKDPNFGEIEKALMGSTFTASITYDENDKDPSRPWLRCTYIPSDSPNANDIIDVEEPF